MKKVLTLAIAAALVAPVAAMADSTIYGKAHMIVQSVDDGTDSVWSTDSVASRVGVKGSEDLGNGLSAVYQFEFGVNPDASSTLSNRNQFVGLAGGFGTFLAGRHDTPMKMSQGSFDEFGDLPYGDIEDVFPGEDRLSNVLAYVSPAMSGLTFVGAVVAGEEGDAVTITDGATPPTTLVSTTPELQGVADHISVTGMYSNGPIFASLAYNSYDLGALDASPALLRGTFVWNGGVWQAGAMFNNWDWDDVAGDASSYGVSGHFMVTPNDKIKAQFLTADAGTVSANAALALVTGGTVTKGFSPNISVAGDGDDADSNVDQWSIGYEHSFSKRTYVHVGYTSNSVDGRDDDITAFFGGLVHSF
jgi:predicted porin